MAAARAHRVVVVGGGFGGLQAVRKLRARAGRRSRSSTGATSTSSSRSSTRSRPARSRRARSPRRCAASSSATATSASCSARSPASTSRAGASCSSGCRTTTARRELPYDSLIVAGGSSYSYFGHDEWRPFAPDVKSLESALEVRRRILTAFEAAEVETDPERRAAWLTFVVVGAGPTGVELAGQIAEIARDTLRRDFRSIDTRATRILLVEMADRVLPGVPAAALGPRARASLERLGVDAADRPRGRRRRRGVGHARRRAASTERIPARTVVWAAGVVASRAGGPARRRGGRRGRPRRAASRSGPT